MMSLAACRASFRTNESYNLLQILREVGLKHEVDDAETFTACAQRVAANWADAAVSYEPAAAAAAAMKVRSRCTGSAACLDIFTLTPSNALPPLQCWQLRRHVLIVHGAAADCRLQSCWRRIWRPRPMRYLRRTCSTSWAASPSCRRPGCVALNTARCFDQYSAQKIVCTSHCFAFGS